MLKGGGKSVVTANSRFVGPGHFGHLVLDEGVEKFSCHYEADLDRSGYSVLDIRPLLWKNGWPVGGDNFKAGTYEIQSERSGFALELAVDFVRMPRIWTRLLWRTSSSCTGQLLAHRQLIHLQRQLQEPTHRQPIRLQRMHQEPILQVQADLVIPVCHLVLAAAHLQVL